MCFMIFWKSWNWPSYSRECLQYWLRWHLLVETTSLTVKKPKSASPCFRLWIWTHGGSQHGRYLSAPTDYGNSRAGGSKINIFRLPATLHNTSWIDDCQVCHGSIEGIPILDPVDVEVAYSHIASRYHSIQWHEWSHGSRYASFG